MSQVWIIHRHDRERTALARLAGSENAVVGPPGDPLFDEAAPADTVILGLSADWEAELEFAHRQRRRTARSRWILVGEPAQAALAARSFDQLRFEFLAYPPRPERLRRLAEGVERGLPLSQRARRDQVSERFRRWFGALTLPDLMRALDPKMGQVPVLLRGEPGTGREVLVRYIHHFGGSGEGELVHLACTPETRADQIEEALALWGRRRPEARIGSVWLDELGQLTPAAQRELASWLDAGPPPGVRGDGVRWLASVDEGGADPEPQLAQRLGPLSLRLPPLRERADEIGSLAEGMLATWAENHREAPRELAPDAQAALGEYPWPGNLRELEAVLGRTLARTTRSPLTADDLNLEGTVPEPLDATSVGELLPDEEGQGEEPEREVASRPIVRPLGAGPWVPQPSVVPRSTESGPPLSERIHPGEPNLRRLASTLSHQVRNPLATLRTFAQLVPERFDDPEFRGRFVEMVNEDVGRIDGLLNRLEQLATLDAPRRDKVDVSSLLETLLEERRDTFRSRHLLVLKELDSRHPVAHADPDQLRLAFSALIDKTLEVVPPRGDVYLASRQHSDGDARCVRVLLRFHEPGSSGSGGQAPLERSLEVLVAELVVRAQGGSFTLGASEAEERVIVVDLPAA